MESGTRRFFQQAVLDGDPFAIRLIMLCVAVTVDITWGNWAMRRAVKGYYKQKTRSRRNI